MRFNQALKDSVKEILRSIFPEFRRQLYFPIKGRVNKVYTAAGQYHCDVAPLRNNEETWTTLTPDGSEKAAQVIKEVAIDSITNGPSRGIFALPAVGSIVRISFYDGDPNYPFVDAVLSGESPALEEGEVAIYQSAGHHVRLKPDGTLAVTAPGNVDVEAGGKAVVNATGDVTVNTQGNIEGNCKDMTLSCENATISASGSVSLGGSGGKGVARIGDLVDSQTMKIKEGSDKVKSV